MSEDFFVFDAWPVAVDRELKRRGYVAMAHLLRTEWDALPGGALGSDIYRDGSDKDEWGGGF
ncbi:hypothetical protein ACIPW9_37085 [Streptomyces sp. NPDC090052]|uniref:hypothetical protein n=1 Tax=Streptomyces sp. NPDC090052 TaxID=3365931 RepID=UPI0038180423